MCIRDSSKAVGQISENDVMLAAASDAVIVGFQVRPSADARKLAERDGVEINTYSVIYDAIDDVTSAMVGMLDKVKKEIVTGQVEVQQAVSYTHLDVYKRQTLTLHCCQHTLRLLV